MSISIQKVPYGPEFKKFANSAFSSLKIASPFITFRGIQYITNSSVVPKIITKVTASNLSSFALEGKALKHLLVLGAEIKSIPNLHAKVYLVDDNKGIITSSNLTASGFSKNVELGIYFENEVQLFESTNRFFNKLWDHASTVTLEALEELEQQIKITKYIGGIHRDKTNDEEDIVPVPAIGQLVYDIEEDEETYEKKELNVMEYDYEECDESGDYFVPLPSNIRPIIDSLNSLDDRRIQTVVNSLSLATKESFENWLENLAMTEFDFLIDVNNRYPYKRYVVRKIIADGSILHLSLLIKILVSDISNENQIVVYHNNLIERVHQLKEEEQAEFVVSMADTVDYLAKFINMGQVNGNKNFAKPNLDKINNLLTICGRTISSISDYIEINQVDVAVETENLIPGFQEIKRKRETLGDEFWNYAEHFFSAIEMGKWNNNLSSINSLFKELGKIKLSIEQIRRIEKLVKETIKTLGEVKDKVMRELVDEFNKLMDGKSLTYTQKEQLKIALLELTRSTGRLVQIYGQWSKDGLINKDNNAKRKLDLLSSMYATFSTIKKWL